MTDPHVTPKPTRDESEDAGSCPEPRAREAPRPTGNPDATALPAPALPAIPRALTSGEHRDLLGQLGWADPEALEAIPGPTPVDRRELAEGLAVANSAYGHPRAAALAARLADSGTRVVVTGQQAGLFGGPLLTLVKAAAAVRWAESLETAGSPAVAIFWTATEDHDWREVAEASLPSHHELLRLSLGEDPSPLLPVGMRTFGAELPDALDRWREAHTHPAYQAWIERVATWYRPDARFGEAFARLLVDVFGSRAPLVLDSQLPELKRAQRPWLRAFVEKRHEITESLRRSNERLTERGLPLQVTPQPGTSPLFVIQGCERRRIEWTGEGTWGLRGGNRGPRPVASLLELIEDNPAAVSPGALARPIVQDAVLGTSVFVLGPGELSYLTQAAGLYETLGVRAPAVALRPQAWVVDASHRRLLEELELSLADLFDPEAARARLARRQGGDRSEPARRDILGRLDELKARALELEPNLERPWEKTRDQVERALEKFAERVQAAALRRDEVSARRLDRLLLELRPEGASQERRFSSAHYPGRYGEGFGTALLDQLGLDPNRWWTIDPEATP